MAEARRAPLLALAAALAVVGAVVPATASARTAGAPGAGPVAPSGAPARALSSSWTCAGATMGPSSTLAGQLVLANPGPRAVPGSVRLVTSDGHSQTDNVLVPGGSTTTVDETVAGAAPGAWVAALVTLYGGMISANQQVSSRWGRVSQPCASAASGAWYFPFGMDLRNAGEYLSLVNPYRVDAVADLSFTTELGQEQPGAFQGVVVPADGMTVIGLSTALRPRTQIAATVRARQGGIVAFETQLVTKPPKLAQVLGTPGALNPVAPRPGVTLSLGAPSARASWWWPDGGEGDGVTESYDVYNPGPDPATAVLELLPPAGAGTGGSSETGSERVDVPAHGWVQVTTNGQPWAVAGTGYVAHLVSTNGVPLVAERSFTAMAPAHRRGLGALMGLGPAYREWLLPGPASGYRPAREVLPTALEVSDPGPLTAYVGIGTRSAGGAWVPVPGLREVSVAPGQRVEVTLPYLSGQAPARGPAAVADGAPLVLSSSQPVLVEENSPGSLKGNGFNLAPAVPVAGGT